MYGPNLDMMTTDRDYSTYLEFVAAGSLDEPLALCDLLSDHQNQRVLMMKQQNLVNRTKLECVAANKAYRKTHRTKDRGGTNESPNSASPSSLQQAKSDGATNRSDATVPAHSSVRKAKPS